MHRKAYLSIQFCLLLFCANAQEEQFTVSGHVTYSNSKDSIRVRLSCTDGNNKVTYTDSLGNYSLTRNINKNLTSGITNGILNCAVLFEPPDYIRCGHCPYNYRELSIESEQPRRISIKLDSIISGVIINATLTEKMHKEQLPASITFNKNSALFSNYFLVDTLLDCVADYLLNCDACFMQIAGFANDNEVNKQQLSEQRAEKVYHLLLKRGVNSDYIEYKAYSDDNVIVGTTDELIVSDRKDKNRVDFVLKRKIIGNR